MLRKWISVGVACAIQRTSSILHRGQRWIPMLFRPTIMMSFQPISYYNFLRIFLLFYSFIVHVSHRLWTPPSAFLPMLFVGAEK
jgi:hypothetical protein